MIAYTLSHKNNNNLYECSYFATQNHSNYTDNCFFMQPVRSEASANSHVVLLVRDRGRKINCAHNCHM